MEKVLAYVIFFNVVLVLVQSSGMLNDPCQVVGECGKFGYFCAKNRTCQCYSGYTPNKSFKRCVGGVEKACKYDEHCIEGAYCEKQTKCQCKDEFFPSEDGLECTSSAHQTIPGVFLVVLLLIYFRIV